MKIKIALISLVIVIAAVSAYFLKKADEMTVVLKCNKTDCSLIEKNSINKVFNERYFKVKDIMQCHVEPIYTNKGTENEKIAIYELFLHFYQEDKISVQNQDAAKLASVCESLMKKEEFSVELPKESLSK